MPGERGSWQMWVDFETQFVWACIACGEMMELVHPAELHACCVLFQIVGYRLNTARYHPSFVFCSRRLLATDWTRPSTTWALCFVSGDHCCWLLTEHGQILWRLCFVTGDHWLPTEYGQVLPEPCVLFKEIIGYRLNKAKYYLSFVFCLRNRWIRPGTTHFLCFVSGDHWLPTEQGQVLPELCVLFKELIGYWQNKAKYYLSFVFCFRRSLLLPTDWTRPNTTRAVCFVAGNHWLLTE